MPQLDKVTLFSQIFWLISLYFLFFLGYVHYYLPHFSKLFKTRSFFLQQNISTLKILSENQFSHHANTFILILLNVLQYLPIAIAATLKHYNTKLSILLISSFKKANSIFLKKYLTNTLKFEISKKVYFKL